ncbi:hypothetical protein TNCV_4194771 [Trichonephila clavipes]|nr:hypothetical protein TNCV_4194771 [Trichonephila clavipes]
MSLSPLKTHRLGETCTLNLPRAQTSSNWRGGVVRRGVPAQSYRAPKGGAPHSLRDAVVEATWLNISAEETQDSCQCHVELLSSNGRLR